MDDKARALHQMMMENFWGNDAVWSDTLYNREQNNNGETIKAAVAAGYIKLIGEKYFITQKGKDFILN